jgi:hypothetical protein
MAADIRERIHTAQREKAGHYGLSYQQGLVP